MVRCPVIVILLGATMLLGAAPALCAEAPPEAPVPIPMEQALPDGCKAHSCQALPLPPVSPVPEPDAYTILLAGLGVIALAARRTEGVALVAKPSDPPPH
jgi:hypothetical protein